MKLNYEVIQDCVKIGIQKEYDIEPEYVDVYEYTNVDGSVDISVKIKFEKGILGRRMSLSNVLLNDTIYSSYITKDIVVNIVESFHELKDLKAIGNDKQKAILNMRHNSKLVRDYCAKVLYEEKKNEVSKNA